MNSRFGLTDYFEGTIVCWPINCPDVSHVIFYYFSIGDHVRLGPGVTATRLIDPAIDIHDVPPVDFIRMYLIIFHVSLISPSTATIVVLIRFYRTVWPVLSHLHEDHFDRVVSKYLRPTMPIISTPNAIFSLHDSGFRADRLFALQTWESIEITKEGSDARITVSAMPGQHVTGLMGFLNEYAKVLPPVMGSIVEFEKLSGGENGESSRVVEAVGEKFRMYVTGDTLYYDELKVNYFYYSLFCILKVQNHTVAFIIM